MSRSDVRTAEKNTKMSKNSDIFWIFSTFCMIGLGKFYGIFGFSTEFDAVTALLVWGDRKRQSRSPVAIDRTLRSSAVNKSLHGARCVVKGAARGPQSKARSAVKGAVKGGVRVSW